ncbi:hypothetical protein F5876DRAFT_81064 [Lentinula aff. lateritia]|uniref:Uncharacterized protein n=1 Tax=Lentinula aff. lateritia TaxID=2804960 RepID=A0ACC1TMY9_9AGAR|nr:hypothetical protein F5876DRAFT_81064 [Lentinula aff. lateritia]
MNIWQQQQSSPSQAYSEDDEMDSLSVIDSPTTQHRFPMSASLLQNMQLPMQFRQQVPIQPNFQCIQVIQSASEAELTMSGNIVYIELRTRNLELSAELRASQKLNSTYENILQSRTVFAPAPAPAPAPATPTATHSSSTPTSGRLPKIKTTSEPLTKEECCTIRFYHEKEWND